MTGFLSGLIANKYLYLFIISMMPIVELRGGMPIGAAMELPFWEVYIICVLGNLLPVPFLIMFAKKLLMFLAKHRVGGDFFQKIINKADEKALSIGKYELLGLCLFVAIPLPGTGAWTGSLIATALRLRLIPSLVAISLGVLISGVIMGVLSYGLFGMLGLVIG
ncbi:MAG: small multi-drug export protein [Angelakisella sp.]|nr:small multi-drug export protein [Angelakisella sp.]